MFGKQSGKVEMICDIIDLELSLPEIRPPHRRRTQGDCLALPVVAETRAPGETVLDSH